MCIMYIYIYNICVFIRVYSVRVYPRDPPPADAIADDFCGFEKYTFCIIIIVNWPIMCV